MASALIAPLEEGFVDVIGDVHGEMEALCRLIERLGYDRAGRHPQGRRLVFVGDLADRGPDSPAVIRLVAELVASGRARAVMGNHELNVLREERKEGNAWFFGEREQRIDGSFTDERLADDAIRNETREFFSRLPLALERDDLRVVHACFDEAIAGQLRAHDGDALALSYSAEAQIAAELDAEGLVLRAQQEPDVDRRDPHTRPSFRSAKAELAVRKQNQNPVRVFTSGLEEVAPEAFWAGGKWRFERRRAWWTGYRGPMTVVGHYWRSRESGGQHANDHHLFAGVHPEKPLGTHGSVMVVDYSIGKRARERHQKLPFKSALAAFRWPEAELVFSD